MSHDPLIDIEYRIEYRGHYGANASEFDACPDDEALEEQIREWIDGVAKANLCLHVENLPRVVAEIREALRVRKLEEEEADE